MTAFTRKSFSVAAPGTDTYRDNHERTFGKKGQAPEPTAPVPLEKLSTDVLFSKALSLITRARESLALAQGDLEQLAFEAGKLGDEGDALSPKIAAIADDLSDDWNKTVSNSSDALIALAELKQ